MVRKFLWAWVACAVWVGAAAAQPEDLAVLRHAMRVEAVERLADMAARGIEAEAPERAERIRAARSRITGEFVRAHGESSARATLEALLAPELSSGALRAGDLRVDARFARSYEKAFRLAPVSTSNLPPVPEGFNPPRTTGYLPEVAAVDPRAAHSMHDLPDYLSNRFTNAALDYAIRNGAHFEVHVGSEVEALADLRNRGYELLGEAKSVNGNYERLFLARGANGDLRAVITGTSGLDRVRHLSLLLRFAGPNGEGVPAERVSIVGDTEMLRSRTYTSLRDGLASLGGRGSLAWIGFKGGVRNALTERALSRRGAEYLRDVLGPEPSSALETRLRAEVEGASGSARARLESALHTLRSNAEVTAGLRASPAEVFLSAESHASFRAMERVLVELAPHSTTAAELVADGRLRLPGGVSANNHVVARRLDAGELKAEELRVTTSRGVEPLKLINNYYGDTMGSVVRALLDTGHTRLAYFGTAGGTAPGVRVGDIHVPEAVYDFRNERVGSSVRNGFLEHFAGTHPGELAPRMRLNSHLGNVYSPAVETMGWLEDVRARGLHAIEVENSYIVREVERYNARAGGNARASLHTSVIISDVPGSEATLGNNNGATEATFNRMIDHYLRALGIQDVEVVHKNETRPPARPLANDPAMERAVEVAERLLPNGGGRRNLQRDAILEVVRGLSAETLAELPSGRLTPGQIPGLSEAERAALEAEVARSYTDAEVLRGIERAEAVVSRVASGLAEAFPNAEFELRVGGGLERGNFSPNRGLTLEVVGAPEVVAAAEARLAEARAAAPNAPEVRIAPAGEGALSLGRGEGFRSNPDVLGDLLRSRALTERGVVIESNGVSYAGRQHDARLAGSSLFSRFEAYEVGPAATRAEVTGFIERVEGLGGRVERVRSGDPRLAGAQGRTILDAEARPVVLLPNDREVRRFGLVDELTHVRQLSEARASMGAEALSTLFRNAEAGDPVSRAQLLQWEIAAKRAVRASLAADAPERGVLDRELARLERVLDPYRDARGPRGTLDWGRVRSMAAEHSAGAASFLLGLFLKELAVVVQSGDRHRIEAFFEGLGTTEFWTHYGLFVVGAQAGSVAYTRFLQRYVRPSFVNTVLKSNVALATGMALPMLAHGQFEAEAFAIDLTGLMLSSTAVTAGLSGIRWVTSLGNLSRVRGLSSVARLAGGVPGWVYAGLQTAVVLYFGEQISTGIRRWQDERRARGAVEDAAAGVLAAARAARGPDDPALAEALATSVETYSGWRDRALAPAMAASERFRDALTRAGREAMITSVGGDRFAEVAARYGHLSDHLERYRAEGEAEVDAEVEAAVERFERDRAAALRAAYEENERRRGYDPVAGADRVSENRLQAYEDEAMLYFAAATQADDPEVAAVLMEFRMRTLEIAARERALLHPDAPDVERGINDVLEEGGR